MLKRNVKEILKFKMKHSKRPLSKSEVKKLGKVIASWLKERRDDKTKKD